MTAPTTAAPSTVAANKCSKKSLSTAHTWKAVGVICDSPMDIRVVYVCEDCSCWTYHEMSFVGYRMETAEDRRIEAEDSEQEVADADEDL